MRKNDIEHIFKSNLSGYESEFDTEKGWQELEPKLDKKRRRFFFFLLPLGLITISLLFYSQRSSFGFGGGNTNSIVSQEDIAENRLLQLIDEVDNVQEQKIPIVKTTLTESFKSNVGEAFSNLKEGTLENGSLKATQSLQPTDESKYENILKSFTSSDEHPPLDEKEINRVLDKFPRIENSSYLEQESTDHLTSLKVSSFLGIETYLSFVVSKSGQPQMEAPKFSLQEDQIEEDDWIKWSILIQGGAGKFANNFSFKDFANSEERVEKSYLDELESIAVSTRFIYHPTKRLSIRGGLEYFQYNEQFAFSSTESTSRIVEGTQRILYNPATDVRTIVTGPVTQSGSEWRDVVNYNKLRSWNLPIGVSYRFGNHRFSLNPGIGLVTNLITKKSGKELFLSEIVNSDDSNITKNNVGFSLYFEPELKFGLNTNNSIVLSPGLRKSFSDWSTQGNVEQKPLVYYFFLGLEQKF